MVTGRIYIEYALYYVGKRVKAPMPCGFGFSKELEGLHVCGWLFYSSLQIHTIDFICINLILYVMFIWEISYIFMHTIYFILFLVIYVRNNLS